MKCTKTTSGKHYWNPTGKDIDSDKSGKWLDGRIFVLADRYCLACGIIDDKPNQTKKEVIEEVEKERKEGKMTKIQILVHGKWSDLKQKDLKSKFFIENYHVEKVRLKTK